MKCVLTVVLVISEAIYFVYTDYNNYTLEKVLVFSRHNLRYPLLKSYSKESPKNLTTDAPFVAKMLTPKGEIMEMYMGKYFQEWLGMHNFTFDECPSRDSVNILANNTQRTIKTAEVFTRAMFEDCNLTVEYKGTKDLSNMFLTIVRNDTSDIINMVTEEINSTCQALQLNEAYQYLQKLIALNESNLCLVDNMCDYTKAVSKPVITIGRNPAITGPLLHAALVADCLLMNYYNNVVLKDIDLDEISQKNWALIAEIVNESQHIKYQNKILDENLGGLLLKYIAEEILYGTSKFTLLVGHDSNVNAILTTMNFEPYDLPNQYEITPIGGKLVFQKWHDEATDENYLKVLYVYPTFDQIREGTNLSMETPPQHVELKFQNVSVTNDGFHLWDEVADLLKMFI